MGETQETAREDRGGYHGVIYELRYTKTDNNYDKNIQEPFLLTNILKYCSNIFQIDFSLIALISSNTKKI